MSKFVLIALVLALSLQAGPLGLVERGQGTPNYDVQIPEQMFINLAPSVPLEVLLKENPQYHFNFRKNESGAELFAYFDPVLPATQVMVTTRALGSILREEPNFERFVAPVVPPVFPPVEPPPCTHNCEPVVPPVHQPGCMPDCHHHHPVLPEEPHHPGHEVPEPNVFIFVSMGLILICFLQPQKYHRR